MYQRSANLPAEEIDIVLWNGQTEDALRPWDPVIFIECKNWSARVGAQALDAFLGKMRRRGLKTGMFIAANGVTGDFLTGDGNNVGASRLIESALIEGMRVIVLTMDDMRLLASKEDLCNLIIDRFCGIYVDNIL